MPLTVLGEGDATSMQDLVGSNYHSPVALGPAAGQLPNMTIRSQYIYNLSNIEIEILAAAVISVAKR